MSRLSLVQQASQQALGTAETASVGAHGRESQHNMFTFTAPFSGCPEVCVSLLDVSSSPERAASPVELLG
jgi:hypothetical protein